MLIVVVDLLDGIVIDLIGVDYLYCGEVVMFDVLIGWFILLGVFVWVVIVDIWGVVYVLVCYGVDLVLIVMLGDSSDMFVLLLLEVLWLLFVILVGLCDVGFVWIGDLIG